MYTLKYTINYYSKRYNKHVVIPEGYTSDGATGVFDLYSEAWWIHDYLLDNGTWSDHTSCSRWQADKVLYDVLKAEGHYIRAPIWYCGVTIYTVYLKIFFNR